MSFDWATFTAAIITGSSTIIAIVIAWLLTRRSLYIYQQKQDLKKTEVRLVSNAIDTKYRITESMLLVLLVKQKEAPRSPQEVKEAYFKFINSMSGFNFLLEEIRIELTMHQKTYKKYNKRISNAMNGIIKLPDSEINENFIGIANPHFEMINSLFNDLVQFIYTRISKKISLLGKKKEK